MGIEELRGPAVDFTLLSCICIDYVQDHKVASHIWDLFGVKKMDQDPWKGQIHM